LRGGGKFETESPKSDLVIRKLNKCELIKEKIREGEKVAHWGASR